MNIINKNIKTIDSFEVMKGTGFENINMGLIVLKM